jgi:DNA-binding NarL/FixJ family response regulator
VSSSTTRVRARIVLADDHTLVAEACRNLLQPEFEVVAIVADGRALIQAAAELKPDVIVSDISMPLLNGLDACEQIHETLPDICIVYLTMNTDPLLAAEAFRRGACGYLLKTSAAPELARAVRGVLEGELYISPQVTRSPIDLFLSEHGASLKPKQLTARQREVLQLLAEGHPMKQVADILHLTTRTVAFHKYRIMTILGIHTNAELVQYAIRNSIIPA